MHRNPSEVLRRQERRTDVDIWHAPELKAELLHGRFVDFSYDVHTHETACFALLTSGRIRIRMRGTQFIARQGDLYAIDADEPHAGWAVDDEGWRLRTLYVDIAHLRSLVGSGRGEAVGLAGPIIRDAGVASCLMALHRCSQERGPALVRDQAYLQFAAQLVSRHSRTPAPLMIAGLEPAAVRRVREFLDEHLDSQVSLHMLARHAGLPPFVLFRAFERTLGMTPHAYQRQARVRLVMKLLRARSTLSRASAMAGFSDQAHCTRWFKRLMGITPGQYQSSLAGRPDPGLQ